MQVRILTLFGIVISVLLVAVVIFLANLSFTVPAQAQPATGAGRHITVVGNGEANGRPDTAYVQIGVETQADTTQEALSRNNAQATAIITKLQELGVAEEDIQTSNFSIHARYDDNGREITSYNVSNTVSVTIRNLDEAGELLDQVVQEGANRVYGISFGVDDPEALIAQARDDAFANARQKAQQLAQTSGTTLGDLLVITENVGSTPLPLPMMDRGNVAEEAAAAVPIQTGEQTFNAQVQVTFALQ